MEAGEGRWARKKLCKIKRHGGVKKLFEREGGFSLAQGEMVFIVFFRGFMV